MRTIAVRTTTFLLTALTVLGGLDTGAGAADRAKKPFPLPLGTIFKGEKKFHRIMAEARAGDWHKLPMGKRMIKFAETLEGVPYVSYTLEIHDRVESPSANLYGLDCWTFFEIVLGFARMIDSGEYAKYTPGDLLEQIQFTRYRNGECTGDYLERIHYLAEWYFENDARGVARNMSKELGGVRHHSKVQEMTKLWKSYRYLKNNPSLLTGMARLERQIEAFPVYMVPQSKIASIEKHLLDGDIIGIATSYPGGFCSHVGIINKSRDGRARFMHASSSKKFRQVVLDKTISEYVKTYRHHVGILVARPLPVRMTVRDDATYHRNLKRLLGKR